MERLIAERLVHNRMKSHKRTILESTPRRSKKSTYKYSIYLQGNLYSKYTSEEEAIEAADRIWEGEDDVDVQFYFDTIEVRDSDDNVVWSGEDGYYGYFVYRQSDLYSRYPTKEEAIESAKKVWGGDGYCHVEVQDSKGTVLWSERDEYSFDDYDEYDEEDEYSVYVQSTLHSRYPTKEEAIEVAERIWGEEDDYVEVQDIHGDVVWSSEDESNS